MRFPEGPPWQRIKLPDCSAQICAADAWHLAKAILVPAEKPWEILENISVSDRTIEQNSAKVKESIDNRKIALQ